jgi:hypothetical protein
MILRSPRSTTSQSCCIFLSKWFLYCLLLSFCIIPCVARNHLKSSISSSILETQVVLERSTRVVPTAIIDPLTWLACLKVLYFSFFSVSSKLCSVILMICSSQFLMSRSKLLQLEGDNACLPVFPSVA